MPRSGFFFDAIIRQDPIDEDRMNPRDNMEDFSPISAVDLQHFKASVDKASATGRAVVATFGGTAFGDIALVPAINMKHPKGVREIADWYMLTASNPDYVHAVFEHQCETALGNLKKIHALVGNKVSAVFVCGTDFGTQTSQFCSPETFRSLYAPYYKRINNWIHEYTMWKSFKHSCGSVEVLVNDFIAAGFDILNPVQIAAAGMDPLCLKEKYGNRIVFWGGGIDTQKTLPFGTPAQVKAEVRRLCRIFGKDGGFVFNSVHNIQANTPVENVIAMVEAVREYEGG
jgi:uroporphyrinogen-III decarboxylase